MNIKYKIFLPFVLLFVFVDQISKIIVIKTYNIQPELFISEILYKINDYLNIVIVWNKGFAFGILQNNFHLINLLYIFTISLIIICLILYALMLSQKTYLFTFSLIIGGAIGNLIDRIRYGAVVDFIDLHFQDFHWYVFNIADIFITFGCLLLVIVEITKMKTL